MSEPTGTPGAGASLPVGFYEQVVTALGHAVIATDMTGDVRYWNPAAEELYGYRAGETLGRSLVDLIVPAPNRAAVREQMSTPPDHPVLCDWQVQDRSGRVFTVLAMFTVLLDDEGRAIGTLGVSDDLTAQRRAETDVRRLAAIVENSADAIMEIDETGLIRTANAAVGTMFGYDSVSLIGRNVATLIPANEQSSTKIAVASVLAGDSPGLLLTKGLHADGTLIDVALRLSAVCDAGGRVVGISGIARDVTEATQIRTALATSEARFRARFEQTGVPQAMLTLDGTVSAVNDAFCLLDGRERAELVGLNAAALRHPTAVPAASDQLAALLGGTVDEATWESAHCRRDGSPVPVMIRATRLQEPDGGPYGVAVFVQDLSQLRHSEQALTRREALFVALGRQSGEWSMVIDADAIVRYVSPRPTGALGHTPEVLTGFPWIDLAHPDDRADLKRVFDRVIH
ncbi:MAG TPA: PAS domain S-box protein, partial [Kineosporiaceae bacterium]|nr:PAS domain S-box protein [Kineosporiaceae bacterium]